MSPIDELQIVQAFMKRVRDRTLEEERLHGIENAEGRAIHAELEEMKHKVAKYLIESVDSVQRKQSRLINR